MQSHPPECKQLPLAGLHFPGNSRGPKRTKGQPCPTHHWKLTSLCMGKLEESTLQQDKWIIFHPSYLTVIDCHPFSVSAAVVLTLIFATGLEDTAPAD
jgi:hypothetical protein